MESPSRDAAQPFVAADEKARSPRGHRFGPPQNKTLDTQDPIPVEFNLSVGPGEQVKFKFKVKKNWDVEGEAHVRQQHWSLVITGASVVIYLVDAAALLNDKGGKYESRILDDFDWLLERTQSLKSNFETFGT